MTATTTVKKRPVATLEAWLNKSNKKSALASVAGFLQAHRGFLETGDVSRKTTPILRKFDDKSLMPTQALQELQQAVFNHIIEVSKDKLEAAVLAGNVSHQEGKPWLGNVFDREGNLQTYITKNGEEKELSRNFSHASEADNWSMRYLVNGTSDGYAVIENDVLGLTTTITRADAIAVILKGKKSPICWSRSKTTKKLGFTGKAQTTRSSFSRG